MGTCSWDFNLQCCDRDNNLFYVYDWTNMTWSNQHITPVTSGEFASSAVEVNSYFLDDAAHCINIRWYIKKCL